MGMRGLSAGIAGDRLLADHPDRQYRAEPFGQPSFALDIGIGDEVAGRFLPHLIGRERTERGHHDLSPDAGEQGGDRGVESVGVGTVHRPAS